MVRYAGLLGSNDTPPTHSRLEPNGLVVVKLKAFLTIWRTCFR